MLASLRSAAVLGVDALPVFVEVDVSLGLPVFTMVGLPDTSVRESRDRVRTAIRNSGFEFPGHRVTVNLAPADVRKAGASYDLPIALGILAATGVIEPRRVEGVVLLGELSLDGSIQAIRGVLPVAVAARREGKIAILLPRANAPEASVVEGLKVLAVDSLVEAVEVLNAARAHEVAAPPGAAVGRDFSRANLPGTEPLPDFADVVGQGMAKRALEIAAAGGHNVLLIGAPGGGKTMMARRLAGILPPLDFDEALDCTSVHSVAGTLAPGTALMHQRPFRAPHHTISEVAMVGGGSLPRPGEISLAHNGVLFLDELPEFDRRVLEALRQPLEEGRVTVARAARTSAFPARFMLVAAMNPCPCGFRGDQRRACRCSEPQIERYAGRISGPLRDRIDLVVEVPAMGSTTRAADAEPSSAIRERVRSARAHQRDRFGGSRLNRQLEGAELREHCALNATAASLLEAAIQRFCLSARGCDRVLRVSRTIADLASASTITPAHVAEAVQYRFIFA
ncbi:MAG TPA: YifB family Mg chelatase-like AAA ATPase [Vicinamibacterales bacterium]|nr:YifB family Mg chelatase-like AAA ATPase [Vicinamibacterales bacterium]